MFILCDTLDLYLTEKEIDRRNTCLKAFDVSVPHVCRIAHVHTCMQALPVNCIFGQRNAKLVVPQLLSQKIGETC